MKFRLEFNGELHAGTNLQDQWSIREALHPQLEELYNTHPVLKGIGMSTSGPWGFTDVAGLPGKVHIEPLAYVKDKINEYKIVKGHPFIPLVRKSLNLACHLDIIFLRKGEPDSQLIKEGGDLEEERRGQPLTLDI
ncbi:MAG: hypothetical protein M1491_03115 [Deltaproteobacteria bacterium]|nr:hypothetical protein [Deltaproteobacteria bacterium]